ALQRPIKMNVPFSAPFAGSLFLGFQLLPNLLFLAESVRVQASSIVSQEDRNFCPSQLLYLYLNHLQGELFLGLPNPFDLPQFLEGALAHLDLQLIEGLILSFLPPCR